MGVSVWWWAGRVKGLPPVLPERHTIMVTVAQHPRRQRLTSRPPRGMAVKNQEPVILV